LKRKKVFNVKMKKRKRVLYLPNSPMAKSLQRFKNAWKDYPESMELRRKRGVEKRSRKCKLYRDNLFKYFVYEQPLTEFSPEILERICYDIRNEKRDQGKWAKIKSIKRFLTKYGFIKYEEERDLYLNCYKIKRAEEERAESDRRNAQRKEEERLKLGQAEAEKLEREAQQRHREVEPKPTQAHRVTQPQQGTQADPGELERLKGLRDRAIKSLTWSISEAEKETDPTRAQGWRQGIAIYKERLSKIDLEISDLEKCGKKLSEGIAIES